MSFSANVHYGPAASGRVVSKKKNENKKIFRATNSIYSEIAGIDPRR